ncbi:MAG TPA: serine/threonine-protein kinase [Nannocystaceae bacterium]|nr:serine/threonine-protein kinase [Nannocystaceae bacterium]
MFADDYRVIGPLAEGGMGSVYRAEQLSTRKPRALKILHGRMLEDDRSHVRFVREATIGAAIASEHVVEVIAAGIDRTTELPYIVMELLDGGDLAAVVKHRGRLDVHELGAMMRQLCHGLAAAHAAKVIHRDLKPENVYVAYPLHAGTPFTVKVLDFGIAKIAQESKTVATLTGTVGSPLWMSPEQINNEALSSATDVWALGLLAFWALTGQAYWRTARAERLTVQALFAEQLFRPLDSAVTRASEFGMQHALPPGFDDWFLACVARSPSERFTDAAAAWSAFAQSVDDGMKADVQLLPPRGEVWNSTSSRLSLVASTIEQHAPSDSSGLEETAMGTTGFGHVSPLHSTSSVEAAAVAPPPPAAVAAPAATRVLPQRGAPKWLPYVIAPIAAIAVALGVWALWPGVDPNARDGVTARVDVPSSDGEDPTPPDPPAKKPPDPPASDSGKPPAKSDDGGDIEHLPPPPDPDQDDVEVVRPMTTQPSFSGSACSFVGWSRDGTRFVLDMTYPDRAGVGQPNNKLRLVEVHESLTGAMVGSYLLERDAAPEISDRDRLSRAAIEAEPQAELHHAKHHLELGHVEATRLPPVGGARIEAALSHVPEGTTAVIEESDVGATFRWTIGTLQAGDEELAVPHIVLRWQGGSDRWELLDVPLVIGARELAALAEPGQTVEYLGTVSYQWGPAAQRVVVRVEARAEHVTEPARTIDARWFLRASGPQIRLVDAGAGQRRLRRIAAQLERAGLPIAAADLDHSSAEGSRTYVRARDAAAAELAVRINTALGLELPSALLQRAGWTQAVVVLGPDLAVEEP